MRSFSRREIKDRLRAKAERHEAIIGASAGLGLVGKLASRAGADFLVGTTTSILRCDGIPDVVAYRPIFDSNAMMLDLTPRLVKVAEDTPVIMGIGAADPRRNLELLLQDMGRLGASGFINAPSSTKHGNPNRRNFDQWGMGFGEEERLIQACNAKDIFSIGEVSYIEEDLEQIKGAHGESTLDAKSARENFDDYLVRLLEAGADLINISFNLTFDNIAPGTEEEVLERCCGVIQQVCQEAKKRSPEVFVTFSGGPFQNAARVQKALDQTDAHGYIAEHSLEVAPVYEAVQQVVKDFAALQLR